MQSQSNTSNKLENYISQMTLDKNRGVYMSDNGTNGSNSQSFSYVYLIILFVLIILVLAYYNINLFLISGNIVQTISNAISPIIIYILKFFGVVVGETAIATTTIASTGITAATTGIENVNQGVSNTIINGVQYTTKNGNGINESAYPQNQQQNAQDPSFNIINTAPQMAKQQQNQQDAQYANDIQYNVPQAFCFIGEQNNTRYCAEVSNSSQCASGDIFPTSEMCVNPNMRVS
jgi:hypothetical protein